MFVYCPGIEMYFSSYNDYSVRKVFKLTGSGCTGEENQLADCSAEYNQYGNFNDLCYSVAGVKCITGLLCE